MKTITLNEIKKHKNSITITIKRVHSREWKVSTDIDNSYSQYTSWESAFAYAMGLKNMAHKTLSVNAVYLDRID